MLPPESAIQWNIHIALARHFSAVGDCSSYVISRKLRILSPNFIYRHTIGQEVKNQRHP